MAQKDTDSGKKDCFAFRKMVSYRKRILAVVKENNEWQRAVDIAADAQIEYRKTLDALIFLHKMGQINKRGCKKSVMWASVKHAPLSSNNFEELQALFNKSVKANIK